MAEDDLGKRIAAARQAHEKRQGVGPRAAASGKGMGLGLRLASELFASVIVGAGLGWGLDQLLHTQPWMLIVWLLLGFAAGIVNVVRAVSEYSAETQDEQSQDGSQEGQEGG